MLVVTERDLLSRVRIIPYGAASVGMALGQMADQNRFPRPSVVFLDGDQAESVGCTLLPGEDAPERLVYETLVNANWPEISQRIGRGASETIDALNRSMSVADHHDWVRDAADRLFIGGDILWQALAASWATNCAPPEDLDVVINPVRDALIES